MSDFCDDEKAKCSNCGGASTPLRTAPLRLLNQSEDKQLCEFCFCSTGLLDGGDHHYITRDIAAMMHVLMKNNPQAFALTAEERHELWRVANWLTVHNLLDSAATLRGLLERTK